MSVTDICNMALGRIGISQFLVSYDTDTSKEAVVCRIFYNNARDRVLWALPWDFATRTAALTDIGTPPAEWLHRYGFPADGLVARKVTFAGATPYTIGAEFKVIENEAAAGLAIVSNLASAILVYTARIINTALFPQTFIDALAWSLAMDLASPLAASLESAQAAAQAYQMSLTGYEASLKLAMPGLHFNEGREEQQAAATKN